MNDEAARQGRPANDSITAADDSKAHGEQHDPWIGLDDLSSTTAPADAPIEEGDWVSLNDLNSIAADDPDEPRVALDDFNAVELDPKTL